MKNLKSTYYKFYIVAQDSNIPALLSSMILCEITLYSTVNDDIFNKLNNFQIRINLNSSSTIFSLNKLFLKPNKNNESVVYRLLGFESLRFQFDITNGDLQLTNSAFSIVDSYEFYIYINNYCKIKLNVDLNNRNLLQFEKDYYDIFLNINEIMGKTANSKSIILSPPYVIRATYSQQNITSKIKYYLLKRNISYASNLQKSIDLNLLLNFDSTSAQISLPNVINSNELESFLNIFNNATSIYPLFQILAVDENNPLQNTTTVLRINYADATTTVPINEKPKFKKLYSTHVLENSVIGTLILQIELDWSTITMDSIKSDVKFMFLNENGKLFNLSTTREFLIDSKTGQIYVNKILDRELRETYKLTIVAVTLQWYIQTDVSIYVDDINDNEPKFLVNDTLIELNINQLMDELSSKTSLNLYQFLAIDNDFGLNGEVYYILESPINGLFSLNPNNGFLSINFNVNTDILKISKYSLYIIALDRGYPQLSSKKVIVTICITSKYDVERRIDLYLPYNVIHNTVLYKFDYFYHQLSFFQAEESNNLLIFNNSNGYLNVNNQSLSKAKINSTYIYFLKLSSESEYIFSKIKITITDVDVSNSELKTIKTQINITQFSSIGAEIYKFSRSDQDDTIKYKISETIEVYNLNNEKLYVSSQQIPFKLNTKNGTLVVNENLSASMFFKYNLSLCSSHSTFFSRKSEDINLVIFIYDKYFDILRQKVQKTSYFYLKREEFVVNLFTVKKFFSELLIMSTKIINETCLTFSLQKKCFDLHDKNLIRHNDSSLCDICELYKLDINAKMRYFDEIKELELTVYIGLEQNKKIQFNIFSKKSFDINTNIQMKNTNDSKNNAFNLKEIILNSSLIPLLQFKLITKNNFDNNYMLHFDKFNFTLHLQQFSLVSKVIRFYLIAYINNVFQDECLINIIHADSIIFNQLYYQIKFDNEDSYFTIESILNKNETKNITLNTINSSLNLFCINKNRVELSSNARVLKYIRYTYIIYITICSKNYCDSSTFFVLLNFDNFNISLPQRLIVFRDSLFIRSQMQLPILKIHSKNIKIINNSFSFTFNNETGLVSLNSSLVNQSNLKLPLEFENLSKFEIDIQLIDIDRFINLKEFIFNKTIDLYFNSNLLTNSRAENFISNLIPQQATYELENLKFFDENFNKFLPLYNLKCSIFMSSYQAYKLSKKCDFYIRNSNFSKNDNLIIRLSNDGYSKSLFFNLNLNFIRMVQNHSDYRILKIAIINNDNIEINMLNFNKYLQNNFDSTINYYDEINKKLLIQVNNIENWNSRTLIQINDEFKYKLNLNREYIIKLFQIEIIKILRVNEIDSCLSFDSCINNKSDSLCRTQLINNNDMFNYKPSIKFKNYEVISMEQILYTNCSQNCDSYSHNNFYEIGFQKLNYVIYKNLIVDEQLFLKLLFKIDAEILNNNERQLIFFLNFQNQDNYISCEIIDGMIKIKFNFDNVTQKVELKEEIKIDIWYRLLVIIKDEVCFYLNYLTLFLSSFY